MTDLVKSEWTEEQRNFVKDLLFKAVTANEKSFDSSNCFLCFYEDNERSINLRVDDIQLLYLGCHLLPNIASYLVNILPQLFYPYIVAYLSDLSTEDHTCTVSELFDLVKSLEEKE